MVRGTLSVLATRGSLSFKRRLASFVMTKGAPRPSNHALRSLAVLGRSSAYVVAGSQCDPAGSRERTLVNAGVLRKPRGSKRLRRFVITRERSSLERLRSTFELSFAPVSRSRERRPRRPLSVPPAMVVRRAIGQVNAALSHLTAVSVTRRTDVRGRTRADRPRADSFPPSGRTAGRPPSGRARRPRRECRAVP